jgi:hypothetical protein
MAQKSMMESVKEEIVSAIKGTGDIVNAVVNTVSGTLTNTIKGTGASIQGVAQQVIRRRRKREACTDHSRGGRVSSLAEPYGFLF